MTVPDAQGMTRIRDRHRSVSFLVHGIRTAVAGGSTRPPVHTGDVAVR